MFDIYPPYASEGKKGMEFVNQQVIVPHVVLHNVLLPFKFNLFITTGATYESKKYLVGCLVGYIKIR